MDEGTVIQDPGYVWKQIVLLTEQLKALDERVTELEARGSKAGRSLLFDTETPEKEPSPSD